MSTEMLNTEIIVDNPWTPDNRPRDIGSGGVSDAHARYVRAEVDATADYLQRRREGLPALQPEYYPTVIETLAEYERLNAGELRSRFG